MKNLKGKKVLLLAPPFYELHNQIIKGLKSLGATVDYIPDIVQKYNPNYTGLSKSKAKNVIRTIVSYFLQPNKSYHKKNYLSKYQREWDYFICIDGYSFDPFIMRELKRKNKNIKTVLYLWDSINFYNFKPLFKYFDKVYTFDKIDSDNYNLRYLPLFWYKRNISTDEKYIYDISFIGSDHTDRIEVLSKINSICKLKGIKTYFKIVLDKSRAQQENLRIASNNDYNIISETDLYDFLTLRVYSESEVDEIISKSRCVLDIVKPNQSGLSNRTIQALASQKKILTTNPSFQGTDLDNGNLQFFDRMNPMIDIEFLKQPYVLDSRILKSINNLQIDNWLLELMANSEQ